ncbi:MAG: ArnT family glycosyltransferase [Gemmatimonadota bacterium]
MTRPAGVAFAAVLLLGFVLRVWAVDFGLPHRFNPDEAVEVFRALQLGAGQFDFTRVIKGGYYLMLFVLYGGYFAFLVLTGRVSGPDEFGLHFATDPTPFWLLGRLLTVALGTATLAVVFQLGRRIAGVAAGLCGMAALSVTLLHVELSHYITLDAPECFFLALAFLFVLRYADAGRTRDLWAGILLIAVGAAFKLSGGALGLSWAVAVLHRTRLEPRRDVLRRAFFAGLGGLALYVALTPGVLDRVGLVDFSSQRVGASFEPGQQRITQLGGVRRLEGWRVYPGFLFHNFGGLGGLPLLLLNLAAVLRSAWRRALPDVLFLAFWVPTVVAFLFFVPLAAGRYLLPNVVLGAPFLGLLVVEAIDWSRRRRAATPARRLPLRGELLAAAFGVLLLSAGLRSTLWDIWISRPDTRELALAWVLENVQPETRVLLNGNESFPASSTAPLPISRRHLERQAAEYRADGAENKATYLERYQIPAISGPGYVPVYVVGADATSLEDYLRQGVRTFILDEGLAARIDDPAGRRAFPELVRLARDLRAERGVRLAATFGPSFPERPGPQIRIYRVDGAAPPAAAPATSSP